MNLQIFNSIVNGELKPWLIDIEEGTLKEIVRQANKMPVNDLQQVTNKLRHLLQPFNNIQKSIPAPTIQEIKQQAYFSNSIEATTLLQHYYKGLIDAALISYYNDAVNNPFIKDNTLDVPFQIGEKSLKGISVLCNQANNELRERGFDDVQPYTDITHFALTYLQNNLLALYFSIQNAFKEFLNNAYDTVEDYMLYSIENSFEFTLVPNENASKVTQQIIKPTTNQPPKFSFGWKGGSPEKLQALFDDLCVDIKFLDEEQTPVKTLIELLTSADVKIGTPKIHLACRTTEFVLVMDAISKHFLRLTQTTIEKSQCFWSKPATNKPSALITSTTISKSRAKNKTKEEVISDIKATIDKHLP